MISVVHEMRLLLSISLGRFPTFLKSRQGLADVHQKNNQENRAE
jgi:hypothetical protein